MSGQAFEIADKEFGIRSPLSSVAMAAPGEVPDRVVMATYLSQFYEYSRRESGGGAAGEKRKSLPNEYAGFLS